MTRPGAYEIPSWAIAILFWRKVDQVESRGIPGLGPHHGGAAANGTGRAGRSAFGFGASSWHQPLGFDLTFRRLAAPGCHEVQAFVAFLRSLRLLLILHQLRRDLRLPPARAGMRVTAGAAPPVHGATRREVLDPVASVMFVLPRLAYTHLERPGQECPEPRAPGDNPDHQRAPRFRGRQPAARRHERAELRVVPRSCRVDGVTILRKRGLPQLSL